jgi:hypothetical protein
MKEKWIQPTTQQISALNRIVYGLMNWEIKLSSLDVLDSCLKYDNDVKTLGLDQCILYIEHLQNSVSNTRGFLDIKSPRLIDDIWEVEVLPTDYLMDVLEGLNAGIWWNLNSQTLDYQKTMAEWQGYLNSSRIPPYLFEQASRNNSQELKIIRDQLIVFKLSGVQGSNGDWVIG